MKGLASPSRLFCKNLLFTAIIISGFFGGVELFLSLMGVRPVLLSEDPLVGFAGNVPLFVEAQQAGGAVQLKTAKNKLRLFNAQAFPKNKAPNSYRIFCMGGSTTHGRPYDDGLSFCGWLRAFLRAADPTRNWEVINAGGISYASYRVTHLMNELKAYQPDLFIVYSGQNEFLEERSYGALLDLPSWMLDLDAMLSATRTYTVMKQAYDALKPGSLKQARKRFELSGEVDEILNHTLGPTSYHRDDALKQHIISHYRLNLNRMVKLSREADADIILVEPAINLKDMSPFKSTHKAGLGERAKKDWQVLYQRAISLEAAGRIEEALVLYRQSLLIDDRVADVYFRIGKILFERKEYDAAEAAFWRAVDEDIAPLRILRPMQKIVEAVAAKSQVTWVDFPGILKAAYLNKYGHAVFGEEYFVDHVHTNMEGYRLLGAALLDHLIKKGIVRPVDSWNTARMETVSQEVIARLDRRAEGLAFKNLGKVLDWAGKFEESNKLFLQALEILGPDQVIYYRLAKSAIARGQSDEAVHYIRRLTRVDSEKANLHQEVGGLLAQQGKTDEAIEQFREELALDPESVMAHHGLAVALVKKGDNDAAVTHFKKAVQLKPDFEAAQLNLAFHLTRMERYDEALVQGRAVLRMNPKQALAHNLLGILLKKQGDINQAGDHFSEALRLNPELANAKKNLQEIQAMRDRIDADASLPE